VLVKWIWNSSLTSSSQRSLASYAAFSVRLSSHKSSVAEMENLLIHEQMARSIPDGVDLTDEAAVIMALVAAGWRGSHVEALIDQVISFAISERDISSDNYGAKDAMLDCIATAALLGGGTSAIFIANILDANVSAAMASTVTPDLCNSVARLVEFGAMGAFGAITIIWFLVWSMAWKSQPARVKRTRRPF
jgi:hypothetical protein